MVSLNGNNKKKTIPQSQSPIGKRNCLYTVDQLILSQVSRLFLAELNCLSSAEHWGYWHHGIQQSMKNPLRGTLQQQNSCNIRDTFAFIYPPIVHVQKKSAGVWVDSVPKEFLELGNQNLPIGCTHGTELLKQLSIKIVINIHHADV